MIPHSLLWYELIKNGIHGRTLNILKQQFTRDIPSTRTNQ